LEDSFHYELQQQKHFTGHRVLQKVIHNIHYVGLSRVTTIERVHITDLSENKKAVSAEVQKEMKRLRSHEKLELSVCPLYMLSK